VRVRRALEARVSTHDALGLEHEVVRRGGDAQTRATPVGGRGAIRRQLAPRGTERVGLVRVRVMVMVSVRARVRIRVRVRVRANRSAVCEAEHVEPGWGWC